MIAALPMYDWPEVRATTDSLWSAIAAELRDRGVEAPRRLTRDLSPETIWRHPDLLLAQTCGYPYMHSLRDAVRLVGTPIYRAPGCEGPRYRSFVLVRADALTEDLRDLRNTRVAYNDSASQSGYSALRAVIAPQAGGRPFFSTGMETGGHAESMEAVAEGRADVCAVDCVCWALARRYRPTLAERLRVLAEGPNAPGLPLIAASNVDADTLTALRESIRSVTDDLRQAEIRDALFLGGFEVLNERAYDRIPELESDARAMGYPELI